MSLAGLGARTVPAALDMAAERSSAANLDRCHDALLGEVEVADIGRAPRLTMAAKNTASSRFQRTMSGPHQVGETGCPAPLRD